MPQCFVYINPKLYYAYGSITHKYGYKMKYRNPFAVAVFSIITFGIYALVWEVKTKNEMNRLGAQIPTAWLLIVPFANIWWLWKYCQGVEKVTGGKLSGIMAFVVMFLLSIVGMAIVQNEFNQSSTQAAPSPAAPGSMLPEAVPAAMPNQPPAGFTQPTVGPTPPAPQNPNNNLPSQPNPQ